MAKGGITDFLKSQIMEIDAETGQSKAAMMAKNMIEIAAGKKGSPREHIQAFNTVIERIDGKVKDILSLDLWDSYPSQTDAELMKKFAVKQKMKKETDRELQ